MILHHVQGNRPRIPGLTSHTIVFRPPVPISSLLIISQWSEAVVIDAIIAGDVAQLAGPVPLACFDASVPPKAIAVRSSTKDDGSPLAFEILLRNLAPHLCEPIVTVCVPEGL